MPEAQLPDTANDSEDKDEALRLIEEVQNAKLKESSMLKKRLHRQVLSEDCGLAALEQLEGLSGLDEKLNDDQESSQSSS